VEDYVTLIDDATALAAFNYRRPTLVMLDVATPVKDTMTLLQTLRALSDVPIILLTTPFKFEELTARIRSSTSR
jgi:DNA-binding response OmpR family regulator